MKNIFFYQNFEELTIDELNNIALNLNYERKEKGQSIIINKDDANKFIIILKGKMRVYFHKMIHNMLTNNFTEENCLLLEQGQLFCDFSLIHNCKK